MRGSHGGWGDEIDEILRAKAPWLWLECDEEPRALAAIERAIAREQRPALLWSCVRGLHPLRSNAIDPKTQDPLAALDALKSKEPGTVLVLLDAAPFLAQALVARRVRELPAQLAAQGKCAVFVSASGCPVDELRQEIPTVQALPPDAAELGALALAMGADATVARRLAEQARGVRADHFALALRMATVRFGALDTRALELARAARDRALSERSLLEPIATDASLDQLGGLDALKRWLDQRARAMSDEARAFGVDRPRGVFVVGVQGGGKSTCARAVAARWGLPLLRMDVGRMFQSLVGASEANVRRALAQAESAAPCVLWIDEVSRAFSDVSGRGDAGISARIFGSLLTWLQDHRAPVFVVATANDVTGLPPELLRKGRFDDVFFVDLPTRIERSEIAAIHLSRRNRARDRFDLDAIAEATEGFSGAEIEQCVVSGLLHAFSEGVELDQGHVLRAARETVALSKTARESIEALRKWAHGRARPASTVRDTLDARVIL